MTIRHLTPCAATVSEVTARVRSTCTCRLGDLEAAVSEPTLASSFPAGCLAKPQACSWKRSKKSLIRLELKRTLKGPPQVRKEINPYIVPKSLIRMFKIKRAVGVVKAQSLGSVTLSRSSRKMRKRAPSTKVTRTVHLCHPTNPLRKSTATWRSVMIRMSVSISPTRRKRMTLTSQRPIQTPSLF